MTGRDRYTRHSCSVAQKMSCPRAFSTSKDSMPLHTSLYSTDEPAELPFCCMLLPLLGAAPVERLPRKPPLVQKSTEGSGAAAELSSGS